MSGPGIAEASFDDVEDAEAAVAALAERGVESMLFREGFAGEDDSDDRPWVVRVEAPGAPHLHEVAADLDGVWVDVVVADTRPPPAAVPLPDRPKRLKRDPGPPAPS